MDSKHTYLINYEKYFKLMKNTGISLLELGVLRGESIRFWRDYFSNGHILGIDTNAVDFIDTTGRVKILKGSQCDIRFLEDAGSVCGPFDIIIDDASHIGEYTKVSFWYLFDNYLKPGGIYVIEDWGTGYYKNFPDGKIYNGYESDTFTIFTRALSGKIDKLSESLHSKNNKIRSLARKVLNYINKGLIKKKFRSHTFGLVGFIKELIDEMGLDIITSSRGNPNIKSVRRFENIDIYPGQIFITKRQK
jgi:hypothetical protein